uniref:Uncharacterized protein n=1 Tax=viral metagenome TaxID=1070528 RepID=A0A6C0DRE6_9ZZZZ
MSFTRFHDDAHRIQKQNEISSFTGRYQLDRPGNGLDLPFQEDPNMRLQYWGANLQNNAINVESDLRGLSRPLNRDLIGKNEHVNHAANSQKLFYSNASPYVEESRASHPAWMYKDLEQTRWENPFLNPLNGIEPEFARDIQTRILEKDYFKPVLPNIHNNM